MSRMREPAGNSIPSTGMFGGVESEDGFFNLKLAVPLAVENQVSNLRYNAYAAQAAKLATR